MDMDWDEMPHEKVKKKRLSPKRRFRAIVRLVIANLGWLIEATDTKHVKRTTLPTIKKSKKSNLNLEHKAILNKAAEYRTPEENQKIYKVIGGFKCFRKYPDNVKMMLASYSMFSYFGPGRIIVREKHYATAIFFIISGEVNVIEEKFDTFLNETEYTVTETLTSGDVFGELCLLHDFPRMETIVSNTPVEFLILNRDDFDIVLKSTVKEEWDYISSLMQTFDYFTDWNKIRIGEICMQSFIKQFKKGDTVLGDGYGRKNYVHFVIKGSCLLIEHLNVIELKYSSGISRYKLYETSFPSADIRKSSLESGDIVDSAANMNRVSRRPYRNTIDQKPKDLNKHSYAGRESDEIFIAIARKYVPTYIETIFMQVCRFSEQACFSLGEFLTNRRIVAEDELTCLLIPSFLLIGRDNIWFQIKQFLMKRIPSTQVVFENFVRERQWRQYRTEMVAPILGSHCTNLNSNVPYSIRIRSDFKYKPNPKDPTTREEINRLRHQSIY